MADSKESLAFDKLYTVEEAAAFLHRTMKVSTIRLAVRRGDLAAVKLGKRYYITEEAMRKWMSPPD